MQISAYDNNLWRVERIQKAAKLACAIQGLTLDQLDVLVDEVKDHKGELVVKWKHQQTPQQEAAFQTAWEFCGEYIVHHETQGEM